MSELRKDYLLDQYVIIATERAKRPHDFISNKHDIKEKVCYFCPGNEHMTPPEIFRDKDVWDIRAFPNKFPAVAQGDPKIETHNEFYTFGQAVGCHEVIVETSDHNKKLADLSVERLSKVFKVFKDRINANSDVKYLAVFKNHGPEAGCSINHTHSQIIGYNIIPEIIKDKEKACLDECKYCSIIEKEKNSDRRCYENNSFVAFTPYASRYPFEVIVLPKRHMLNITEFYDDEFMDLAEIMNKILLKLKELNADYNFYFQYGIEKMHFHIEITPRLAKWAGFELATGTIINSMPPEEAAKFYREE